MPSLLISVRKLVGGADAGWCRPARCLRRPGLRRDRQERRGGGQDTGEGHDGSLCAGCSFSVGGNYSCPQFRGLPRTKKFPPGPEAWASDFSAHPGSRRRQVTRAHIWPALDGRVTGPDAESFDLANPLLNNICATVIGRHRIRGGG